MRSRIDLTGRRIGNIEVIREEFVDGKRKWLCRCDCSNEVLYDTSSINASRVKTCGKCRYSRKIRKNLNGNRYGMLEVKDFGRVERVGEETIYYYLCRCDCGNILEVRLNNLGRSTNSCGCGIGESNKRIIKNTNKLRGNLGAVNALFRRYNQDAKMRGLEFSLSIEEFIEITSLDCHYCGRKPENEQKTYVTTPSYFYNGIDRYNNSVGYTYGNSVTCCKRCNTSKGNLSYEEFIAWVCCVYKIAVERGVCI